MDRTYIVGDHDAFIHTNTGLDSVSVNLWAQGMWWWVEVSREEAAEKLHKLRKDGVPITSRKKFWRIHNEMLPL